MKTSTEMSDFILKEKDEYKIIEMLCEEIVLRDAHIQLLSDMSDKWRIRFQGTAFFNEDVNALKDTIKKLIKELSKSNNCCGTIIAMKQIIDSK